MSMLELNRVKKSFGDNPVIRDISLSVEHGDVVITTMAMFMIGNHFFNDILRASLNF